MTTSIFFALISKIDVFFCKKKIALPFVCYWPAFYKMVCHSKLQQSATNAVIVQYILQTACHDRNNPSPNIWKKKNLVLISHLHPCKLTTRCGGRGHEPLHLVGFVSASWQSSARCEPCLSKSWRKESLQNLCGTSTAPVSQWVSTGVLQQLQCHMVLPCCHARSSLSGGKALVP